MQVFGFRGSSNEEEAEYLPDRSCLRAIGVTLQENTHWMEEQVRTVVWSDEVLRNLIFAIEIVDRVKRGDGFAARFLFGWLCDGIESGVRYGPRSARSSGRTREICLGLTARGVLTSSVLIMQGAYRWR